VLPNDLDLDLMFGDGLDGLGLFGAADALAVCGPEPSPADRPPIGLALRKTQSLVDLINAQLSAQQQQQSGEAKCAAGAAPMQCA
jgi:ABC-type amino acid transport substrate-binding protein